MTLLLYFLIAAFTVFLDLFTKFLVKGSEILMSGGVIEIIPGAFRLRYIENPGAAMGSFASNRWVFMIFSTVAIVAIIAFLVIKRREISRLLGISLSLVLGGGIGNMYERLFNQNDRGIYVVTDFFDFYLFGDLWKWVFNVADVAVCVGAGLMILYLILDLVKEAKMTKHPEQYDELLALDLLGEDTDDLLELQKIDGAGDDGIDGFSHDPDDDSFEEGDEVDLDALEEIYLDDGGDDLEEYDDGDTDDDEETT